MSVIPATAPERAPLLITRPIAAIPKPGDLVVDPAAGYFVVMHAAHGLGRDFIGCDLAFERDASAGFAQVDWIYARDFGSSEIGAAGGQQ